MNIYKAMPLLVAPLLIVSGTALVQAQESHPTTPHSQTQKSLPDSAISSKVRALLKANDFGEISVKTEMGVVSLGGTVESDQTREALARMVASVEGVKGVETSNLTIKKG